MFSDYLKAFRKDHDLSLNQLAEGLSACLPPGEGISRMNLWHWERGQYAPARPVTLFYYVRQHAPAESWQRAFAERGEAVLMTAGENQ